jgi:protein gp37
LSLLIVGGESGRKARPMAPAWALDLAAEATAAQVPFFFKQHGEYTPYAPEQAGAPTLWLNQDTAKTARTQRQAEDLGGEWQAMWRVGKTAAGRTLEGQTWDGVVASWAAEMELVAA